MSKQVTVPDNWCDNCSGKGHVALHGYAITMDEWYGPDWDDQMREDYLSGGYDTPCEVCKGKGFFTEDDLLDADMRAEYRAESAAYRMGY